ncbi:hypothetical protein RYZ20_06485 [Thioclava sp. A2]|uniref:hypothetical protein n=1 Tax=Thioclava sp. FCG-A2 TaxID=3080562 RepID=UPI0029530F38|nr:hypothetical protein [Thioclava sp. A2]MDV7270543.1 hypothetical protein [Thioclava sp. A2]
MRVKPTLCSVSVFALSAFLAASSAQAKSFSPSDFVLTLKDDDSLEIGYGSSTITIDAGDAWAATEDAAGKTYTYSGPITIGDFSIGDVDASIGPDGVKLVTPAGFGLGDLTLSAGELALELLPGDQITDQPDFLTFDSKDFVLYTAISTGLEIGIGDTTSISIPTPVDVAASLAIEVKNGSLYYEGPIPSPAMLANGVNKFIKSASGKGDDGNMLTGGFGFSVDGDFTYTSEVDVYQSSKKDPAKENFSANVVMVGEFELADMATAEGTFFVDVETGEVGVNAAASIGFDMLGASVAMEIGTGSFVVDKDGVRIGMTMDTDDDFGLPSSLANIAHFLVPMLGEEMTGYGTLKTGGDFIFAFEANSLDMYGIDMSDTSFSLSSSGLEVSAKMDIDGFDSKLNVSGAITDDSCYLDIEKFKFMGFDLSSPKIKPCDMAEDAAMAFVGDIKIMGYTLSSVDGTSYATDAAKAFLSKDQKFTVSFDVKEKFGVDGGLAGGYVKLAASGDADMKLSKEGELSGDIDFDGSAKFCGKVKLAGKKVSKCKKVSSGISQSFDADVGCIKFSASTKIFGETIKLNAGEVCPWPDTGSYETSDDYDSTDGLDSDDLGTTLALKTSDGKYVSWSKDRGAPGTTSTVSDYIGWTFINFDDSNCLKDGSVVGIRLGDEDTQSEDWYMRVKKDKSTALNGEAGDTGDGKKKFYIGKVKMAGTCLSDGDVITLKNREYKRYWSNSNGTIVATNDKDDSEFTVVFDPGWE